MSAKTMHVRDHDPRTWVRVRNGKPLMHGIKNECLAHEYRQFGSLRALATHIDESGCNVSHVSLSMWISGKTRMDNTHVLMMADALHISPLDLLGTPANRSAITGTREDLTKALEALGRWYGKGTRPSADLIRGLHWLRSASPSKSWDTMEGPDAMAEALRSLSGDWRDHDALARDALGYYLDMNAGSSRDMITPIVTAGRNSAAHSDSDINGRIRGVAS